MSPTKLTAIGSALLLLSGGMSDAGTSLTHVIGLAACGVGCIVAALLVWRGEQSGYKSIGVAFVSNGCELLLPIYWDRGYFYAVVEYESGSSPEYKLTIC